MSNSILPADASLSLEQVIIIALQKSDFKEIIVNFMDFSELNYHVLKVHFDMNVHYSFPEDIVNDLMYYFNDFNIKEHGKFIESSAIMHGADKAAYPPDGSWSADLYEFLGHYMWIEPEGEEYGFFSSLKSAQSFGDTNWIA